MKYLLNLVFLFFVVSSFAQNKKEDVLYLNNGSVIRGMLLPDSGQLVRIQTLDGSVWVFNRQDFRSIGREKRFRTVYTDTSGFSHYTELGVLASGETTRDGFSTAAFSIQTINGYKIGQYAMLGIGVGLDLYTTQTMLPLFLSFRGDLTKRTAVVPFYFIDAGYGTNLTKDSDNGTHFKGGAMYAAGVGLKLPFSQSGGCLISFGYRYQQSKFNRGADEIDNKYRRLAIRAGFFL